MQASHQPLLKLENIHRTYYMGDNAVNALSGVSLQVDQGEYVAIIGSSGSGKSSLLYVLGCLDRPSAGSYVIEEADVAHASVAALANVRNRLFGFVFQHFFLLNHTTALENVELPLVYRGMSKKERRIAAESALDRVGLKDRMLHKPSELSGGQQQRVALARAIVNRPKILFADEPTGNLDSKTGAAVIELIRQLHEEGLTIVLVTHEERLARTAHRIVTMEDGTIVKDIGNTPTRGSTP